MAEMVYWSLLKEKFLYNKASFLDVKHWMNGDKL